jgi:phage tail sheath protein FI
LCDIEGSEATITAASLIANKGTPAAGIAGYMAFFSTFVKAQGVTLGTERTIPFSPIAAGLFAKVSATGTDNRAPAGPRYPLAPFVISLVNTFNESTMEELNNANINCIAERRGVLCLYGDVSALSQSKDLIFWQYSAGRERMRLTWEGEEVLERSQFITLDGRHQKRAQMQGELQAIIANQWRAESLYGATAAEAGIVIVGPPVNTEVTEQEGQLNAEMQVHLSPVVQGLKGILVSVPITEVV